MKSAMPVLALLCLLSTSYAAEQINWIRKYDVAASEAKKTARPIFIDVYADWCQWCHKLDMEVYTNPRFVQYVKGYVPLKLDSEDNGEGTRIATRYKIDGLPAMLVIDANGKLLNKLSGYMKAEQMIQDLDRVQKLLDAERSQPGSDQANFDLAQEYIDREMYSEAETRFQKILASPHANSTQKEKAQFSVALAEYYQGQLKPALQLLEAYYKTYPAGASNEDALLLLSQVYIELDASDKAMKSLREFMKKYPNSSNAGRAKQVLEALEKD